MTGHHHRVRIKDSAPATHSPYDYTWEVVVCMVITNIGCVGPDI